MSFLNSLPELSNLQDPDFSYVVSELLNKVDSVNRTTVEPPFTVTTKKYDVISTFIKSYRTHIGPDIYPTVRLVLPNKDKRLYFMKSTELISFILKLYNIPRRSSEEKFLKEWKINHHNYQKLQTTERLDLPSKIAKVISNKRGINHKSTKTYTVGEINDVLDQLSTITKNDDRNHLLKPVLENLKIDEVRWFLNIILRNSNLGFVDKLFFEAWNPASYKLYVICNDLSTTFRYFSAHDSIDPHRLIPQVRYPFQPQASQKLTISYETLCANMSEFYIEEKVDGDRMLLHYDNGNFKYFTRRIRDYTLVYGENFQTGSLSRYLKDCFHPGIKKIILDGEMVAYDNVRQCILPFGTLKSAAIQDAVFNFNPTDVYSEQGCSPLLLVFDCLQINDRSLVNSSLKQRKEALRKAVTNVPHKLEILDYNLCSTPEQIENAVKGVIVDRSEGIMVKNVQSSYHFGERHNSWIKVKPEYLDSFGENIDVTIIGIIPGRKNSYMCGLYDVQDKIWRSFCTVANGFTNEEFRQLNDFFEDKMSQQCPENVKFGKKKPLFYINPENSMVLEIKARCYDQRTDETYATETTLRNLYCRSIRHDKSFDECISYQEYEDIRKDRTTNLYDKQDVVVDRRAGKSKSHLETSFKLDFSNTNTFKLFENFKFVILSDKLDKIENVRIKASELKKLVKKFGGEVVMKASYGEKPCIIISEKSTPSCTNYLDQGYDIVSPDWLFHCIEYNTLIPLEASVIYASKNQHPSNSDEYGDSYAVTPRIDFQQYLLSIPNVKVKCHLEDISEVQNQELLLHLFEGTRFKIVDLNRESTKRLMTQKIARFSGTVVSGLQCDYVVVPNILFRKYRNATLSQVNKISKQIASQFEQGKQVAQVVMESFIDESIKMQIKVDPQDHKVV